MYVLMIKTGQLEASLHQPVAASFDKKAIEDFMDAEVVKLKHCVASWKTEYRSSWPDHLCAHGIKHVVPIDAVRHFHYYVQEVPGVEFESPEHCWKSPDRKHEPDLSTAMMQRPAWAVVALCRYCQRAGTLRVDPKEIQW